MKKDNTILLILALIIGLAFAYNQGYLGSLTETGAISGSGSYIERPVFSYDKCEAVSSATYSPASGGYLIATNGQWLGKPSATNFYDIIFTYPNSLTASDRMVYSICRSESDAASNCRVYKKEVSLVGFSREKGFRVDGVLNDEYVFAQYQVNPLFSSWKGGTGATYQIFYTPYGIRSYNVLGGSANPVNANGCTYLQGSKDTLLSTNSQKINNAYLLTTNQGKRVTNENTLQPEEVRWYVAGYVTSAAPSFQLNYGGKDAWCRPTGQSGEIYAINTVTVSGGTYKIASADWSDLLGTVDCCPGQVQGDKVCNSNYQYEQIAGAECGAFKSCGSPNWVPYDNGELIKYSCVNGYCESQTKEVECASNADCTGDTICDLNTFECVSANVNLPGEQIDIVPDNQQDCMALGGTWVKEGQEKKSLLNYLGIGEPKLIITEYCDMKKTDYLLIILIIGGILTAFWVFSKK